LNGRIGEPVGCRSRTSLWLCQAAFMVTRST